jgi:hypothetical protein
MEFLLSEKDRKHPSLKDLKEKLVEFSQKTPSESPKEIHQ